MDIEIREFITYLHNRKRTSHNTEVSYQRDLKKMAVYFADRGIYDIRDVGELELEGYLSYMERGQFASSTISRNEHLSVPCFSIFIRRTGSRGIRLWN